MSDAVLAGPEPLQVQADSQEATMRLALSQVYRVASIGRRIVAIKQLLQTIQVNMRELSEREIDR